MFSQVIFFFQSLFSKDDGTSQLWILYSKITFTQDSTNEIKLASNMFAAGKATVKNISVYIFTALSKLLGDLPETTTCKFFFPWVTIG